MLHIIKSTQALSEATQYISESDELLLIEDAVYAANTQHKDFGQIKGLSTSVLENDLAARGILNRVSPSLRVIPYSGFVSLTVQCEQSLTWN